jgi:hypothetical protein
VVVILRWLKRPGNKMAETRNTHRNLVECGQVEDYDDENEGMKLKCILVKL